MAMDKLMRGGVTEDLNSSFYLVANFFFFVWLHSMGCRILAPQPGIKPMPSAVKAQSLNRWTTWEIPGSN